MLVHVRIERIEQGVTEHLTVSRCQATRSHVGLVAGTHHLPYLGQSRILAGQPRGVCAAT
jgi:hypothetical protein